MLVRTIGAKGQVTIPIEIRINLGLQPGDKVIFGDTGNGVVIKRADGTVRRMAGMLNEYARDLPTVAIEDMKEAAAAGWARESINANHENHR